MYQSEITLGSITESDIDAPQIVLVSGFDMSIRA